MTEEQIKKLEERMAELVFMLGVSSALLIQCKDNIKDMDKPKYKWLLTSIENLVYQDKPIPPFPDNY